MALALHVLSSKHEKQAPRGCAVTRVSYGCFGQDQDKHLRQVSQHHVMFFLGPACTCQPYSLSRCNRHAQPSYCSSWGGGNMQSTGGHLNPRNVKQHRLQVVGKGRGPNYLDTLSFCCSRCNTAVPARIHEWFPPTARCFDLVPGVWRGTTRVKSGSCYPQRRGGLGVGAENMPSVHCCSSKIATPLSSQEVRCPPSQQQPLGAPCRPSIIRLDVGFCLRAARVHHHGLSTSLRGATRRRAVRECRCQTQSKHRKSTPQKFRDNVEQSTDAGQEARSKVGGQPRQTIQESGGEGGGGGHVYRAYPLQLDERPYDNVHHTHRVPAVHNKGVSQILSLCYDKEMQIHSAMNGTYMHTWLLNRHQPTDLWCMKVDRNTTNTVTTLFKRITTFARVSSFQLQSTSQRILRLVATTVAFDHCFPPPLV